jgi:hypothetical protein
MAKNSPKKRTRKAKPKSTPATPKNRVAPPSVNNERMSPAAAARARQYYKDYAEILGSVWRSIYG